MDVSFAVILLYTLVLGLVAPYISVHSDKYGVLVPPTIALVAGSVSWAGLVWLGLSTDDAWTWLIVMAVMPGAMVVGSRAIAVKRDKAFEARIAAAKN